MSLPLLSASLTEIYEPLRVIGYGGFAIVVLAIDRRTGRKVAIKHFMSGTGGKERRRLFRELKFLHSLSHANIVTCLDLFTADDDSADLILEFAEGGSLRKRIGERGRLPVPEALRVLSHVARGLVHAHMQGVLHRDIKPENLLIFRDGGAETYKLTDFGIAKALGDISHAHTNVGSPAYMAPEQFFDQYSYPSDVYSLGVVFYEMLHGRPPFEGTQGAIFRSHMEEAPTLMPGLAEPVADLLQALLAKKPVDRPTAAEALEIIDEIRQGVDPDGVHSTPFVEVEAAPDAPSNPTADTFFGDMFDVPGGAPAREAAPDPEDPDTEVEGVLAPMPPAAPAQERTGWDDLRQGWGDSPFSELAIATDFAMLQRREKLRAGRLEVEPHWTRLLETGARQLLDFQDGGELVLVTGDGLRTMSPSGRLGSLVYAGNPSHVGRPCLGSLALMEGGEIRVLKDRKLLDRVWYIDAAIDTAVVSPSLDAVVITMGRTVYFHDADSQLLWTASMSKDAASLFVSFDRHGRLVVIALRSEDHAVHYYDREGVEVAHHWLPGPVLCAALTRGHGGAWVAVSRRSGPALMRVAMEGMAHACDLPAEFDRLVGGRDWVAGSRAGGELAVVEAATGHSCQVPVDGQVLGMELGPAEDEIYWLEERSGILKYLRACGIRKALPVG
jgi:hypothetical protein